MPLPKDWSDRWLASEYTLDTRLNQAWRDRYSSPEAMAFCERQVSKAFGRMVEAARMMPDPAATVDRAALADAVTRGRSSGSYEGKAPDLSRMSDREFEKYKEGLGF